MNFYCKVIPESEQRPEVNGCDWYFDENRDIHVRVSPLSEWKREALLMIHELVEAVMCKNNGVSQASVDEFDIEFDKTHPNDLGAGDDPNAPYAHEHRIATAIEMILCAELGVEWQTYQNELIESYPGPSHK